MLVLQVNLECWNSSPKKKKKSAGARLPVRECVRLAWFRIHTVTLAPFSSRLKDWKGKLMSTYYTETTSILHYFTHILSSDSIQTHHMRTQTCEHTNTGMPVHWHILTQINTTTWGRQKMGADIFTCPSTLHTTPPCQVNLNDAGWREGDKQMEGGSVKWWKVLRLQIKLRSSIFRQWRREVWMGGGT